MSQTSLAPQAPHFILMLDCDEQEQVFKSVISSQSLNVRVIKKNQQKFLSHLDDLAAAAHPTVLVVEFSFLNAAQKRAPKLAEQLRRLSSNLKVLISVGHAIFLAPNQIAFAREFGALGLVPSLSIARVKTQTAQYFEPLFAQLETPFNSTRALAFLSGLPSTTADLSRRDAHQALHRLEAAGQSIEQLNLWAVQVGFEVKNRSFRFTNYPNCFTGTQAVAALCQYFGCSTKSALQMGDLMMQAGLIHHCTHEHKFLDENLFYRFLNAGPLVSSLRLSNVVAPIQSGAVTIQDRQYLGRTYPQCFVGSQVVKWMVERFKISADEAVYVGQQLVQLGLIRHVTQAHAFRNSDLFYEFCGAARLPSKPIAGEVSNAKVLGALVPA